MFHLKVLPVHTQAINSCFSLLHAPPNARCYCPNWGKGTGEWEGSLSHSSYTSCLCFWPTFVLLFAVDARTESMVWVAYTHLAGLPAFYCYRYAMLCCVMNWKTLQGSPFLLVKQFQTLIKSWKMTRESVFCIIIQGLLLLRLVTCNKWSNSKLSRPILSLIFFFFYHVDTPSAEDQWSCHLLIIACHEDTVPRIELNIKKLE